MKSKRNKGQSIAEYIVLFSVILIALLSTNFIGQAQRVFYTYFDKGATTIKTNNGCPFAGLFN